MVKVINAGINLVFVEDALIFLSFLFTVFLGNKERRKCSYSHSATV